MSEAADKLAAKMREHEITIDVVFVPFSQSRNAAKNPKLGQLSLNWRVTLKHKGRDVFSADYSAGVGHCPSYKQTMHGRLTLSEYDALVFECEKGKRARVLPSGLVVADGSTVGRVYPILPTSTDVLSSLLLDAEVIDYARYEDFAREMGYDEDSRKGEQVYRQCLECGLALRAAFGDALLTELRELAREL